MVPVDTAVIAGYLLPLKLQRDLGGQQYQYRQKNHRTYNEHCDQYAGILADL